MKKLTTILKSLSIFLVKNLVNVFSLCIATVLIVKPVNSNPEIVFLDVGQGDAILMQQNSFQVLVDGGPDNSVLFEIGKYIDPRDKRIEVLVLTHPHADHIKGLLYVLEKYEVDEIWINGVMYDSSEYAYLLEMYEGKIRRVSLGDSLKYGNIQLSVLYPFYKNFNAEEILKSQDSNINNESVVLNLHIKNSEGDIHGILLMGDAEKELEKKLLERDLINEIDILKAGHHCSNTASSECFLELAKPTVGICSVGERNRFGHPHSETLQNFKSHNVQYLTTDEKGNIVFTF